MLLNYTPHEINILDEKESVIRTIPPEPAPARVETTVNKIYWWLCPQCGRRQINDADVCDLCCIECIPVRSMIVTGAIVPKREEGTTYIVSRMVKDYCRLRGDMVVPDEIVRDSKGNIVGCRAFSL